MKIVCMIGTPAYLNYFVNEIASQHEIAWVIRENTGSGNLVKKILQKGIFTSARLIANRLLNRKKWESDYNRILGEKWQHLSAHIPLFATTDINSEEVIQKLREIKPDIILVHGTSLIRNKTLAGTALALNLHWGLSPYYKGSYCTQWALLNHDPYNIGYTIHLISSKIDGGDILTQGRVAVEAGDTANRINMRLTKSGTQEVIDVISRIKNKETPDFKTQNSRAGNLYLVKHWTQQKQKELNALENPASITSLLENPVAQALPIIKW